MKTCDLGDRRIQDNKLGWRSIINAKAAFNGLSAIFFCITAYLLLSDQEWSATGRGVVSFLCAFSCALIGNLDRFESVKASLSGIEAKTREIERTVDEARVAIREFHALAEMTGSFLIELMAGAGRFGGTPPDLSDDRRSRITDALTKIGLAPDAIKRVNTSDEYWVKIDYSFGILGGIRGASAYSDDLKAAATELCQRSGSGHFPPTPQDFVHMVAGAPSSDPYVNELIEDYKYYADHGEHRRPSVWRDRLNWPH